MGFRTVVMLNNDQAHQWQHDAELGQKISRAMNHANDKNDHLAEVGSYGRVVECVHADNQTLAVLDGYTSMRAVAFGHWMRDESRDEISLKLLKEAAKKIGYRLVRQRADKD
jgi:hypothetical protein